MRRKKRVLNEGNFRHTSGNGTSEPDAANHNSDGVEKENRRGGNKDDEGRDMCIYVYTYIRKFSLN